VVVISPEKSEFIKQSIQKTGAEFTILFDDEQKISDAFDSTFLPNSIERFMYNTVMRANLKESHADDSEQLPIPATYIINQDSTIKWRHFDPDYKKRSKATDILNNL
jgi:peroxiredoxin